MVTLITNMLLPRVRLLTHSDLQDSTPRPANARAPPHAAAAESSKTAKQAAHDLFGQERRQGAGCSRRVLVDLLGVGNNPTQGLIFGRKAVDPPLLSCVISYHHVPTRSVLVLEGQHHGLFVHGFRIEGFRSETV